MGTPNPTPTKTSELSKPTSIYFVGPLKKATKITLLFHPQSLFIHSPALLYLKEPYLLFLSIKINYELLKNPFQIVYLITVSNPYILL